MNTKNHPLEQEELMAYLDGELRPELATIAAAHLERCEECRAAADDLRQLSQELARWEIEMASAEIPPAIGSAVDVHVQTQKKRVAAHRRTWRQILGSRRLVWEGGIATACLIVVLAVEVFRTTLQTHSVGQRIVLPFIAPQAKLQAKSQVAGGGGGDATRLKMQDRLYAVNGAIGTDAAPAPEEAEQPSPVPNGPMIVRTAQLVLVTKNKDFDNARSSAEEILKRHGGYVGQLTVSAPAGQARTLSATFRIPAAQLDAAMAELKKLGRVESESQGGEEVTQQYVDLQARLANARHTEQRLSDLLRDRTGKLSDVLAFEKEIDRVRGEIESMEAQRKSLAKQVTYATLTATMTEDYGAPLEVVPPSTSTRFRNAAIEGYRAVADGIVSVMLFLLSAGPSILIWGGILFVVARLIWKRIRRRIA
ncbi:MAG TPA: DUF4349 domain-containing protein [Candidatus Angelobacter sp.]|nr:DUF4349 domain-containing protein [Candidatus Angelobacter sp.]